MTEFTLQEKCIEVSPLIKAMTTSWHFLLMKEFYINIVIMNAFC